MVPVKSCYYLRLHKTKSQLFVNQVVAIFVFKSSPYLVHIMIKIYPLLKHMFEFVDRMFEEPE
jgi:hypothetical protein